MIKKDVFMPSHPHFYAGLKKTEKLYRPSKNIFEQKYGLPIKEDGGDGSLQG